MLTLNADTRHEGRRYLISAGSSGLGLATAQSLITQGGFVSICGRSSERLDKAMVALRQVDVDGVDGRVIGSVCDVREANDVDRWLEWSCTKFGGGFHGLVINTGSPKAVRFEDASDHEWRMAFELLLLSAVRLSRQARPYLERDASIVFFTSSVIREPKADLVISSVLRAGVQVLAKVLSRELAPTIRVNHLMPGRIATDRVYALDRERADRSGSTLNEVMDASVSSIPLGRYGIPEEFGMVAAFLLSPEASYVNGASLQVDGGLLTGV